MKPDQTFSNRIIPDLTSTNSSNRLKSNQTGPDRLKLGHKPILTSLNQTRLAQTRPDWLKPVLTVSNQT